MRPMSLGRARLLLWGGALLLVPLPFVVAVHGSVPVVRFALLGAVSGVYAAAVDGSGVAWTMTASLAAHALVYAALLALPAALLARALPAPWRRAGVWSLLALGFATALLFDVYWTPFDDVAARSDWLGLFP